MATATAPHRTADVASAPAPAPTEEADRHSVVEPAPAVADRTQADLERECADAECPALFLALVTAALVTSGLTLATDVVGIPRVLLGFGAAALVAAVTITLARPRRA